MRKTQSKMSDETKVLRAQRYSEWLKSVGIKRSKTKGTVIIQMIPMTGKSARRLSQRELDVLQLVSFGHSTEAVAKILALSAHTVNNHRKSMLTHSGCGNLAELVRVAIREDLLH